MDFGTEAGTLVVGIVLGAFADRIAVRRERDRDRRVLFREAGDVLLLHLRLLRDVARDSQYDNHQPREWAECMTGFCRAHDDLGHRLPSTWGHMKRSVRAAVGEFAGGVAMADVDKRMVDYPLPPHDQKWLTNAVEYLEYVIFRMQAWRDDPTTSVRRTPKLLDFDSWLARRA